MNEGDVMNAKMNPVNWFEIPTKDINRAKSFYEKVFGVKLDLQNMDNLKMAWFPMEDDAPGSTGSLVQADAYKPSYEGTLVYFSVEDIDGTLTKVEKNGGKILNKKMSIGEYGFVGHFEDTEGNRVALHSMI